MTDEPSKIDLFWEAYCNTLPADHPHRTTNYEAWPFGDSPQMANDLGALVVGGTKTATAGALWDYEAEGADLPNPGDLSIILDGQNEPWCIICTTEVRVLPFNEVDAAFAHDEGEGDRSLAFWRRAHEAFFRRTLPKSREFAETMPVVCERFELIFVR